MSARFVFYRLLATLALSLLTVETASAVGVYIGGGPSRFSLDSDYSAIDRRSANGFTFFSGVEFAPTWFAELTLSVAPEIDTGPTENIFYPEDSAEYVIVRGSMRKSFWESTDKRWVPWIAAGAGYHYINWDTYYYYLDGSGLSVAAGVDVELTHSWHLRMQAAQHRFSARDNYDYGPFHTRVLELSGVVIYYFLR